LDTLDEDLEYIRRKTGFDLLSNESSLALKTSFSDLKSFAYKAFSEMRAPIRRRLSLWYQMDLEAFQYNFYDFARVYKPYFLRLEDLPEEITEANLVGSLNKKQ